MEQFDVVVIGSGPGGYVAAIRAAQLGLKTACVEKYPTLGGTCLNVGCIPSKALLQSSELYHAACEELDNHGVELPEVKLNLGKMMARKRKVVDTLTGGVDGLLKKNKVTRFHGLGKLLGEGKVEIAGDDGVQTIAAEHIVIATGSKPAALPFMPFDDEYVVHSTGALSFDKPPKKLLVIGGGVIGLEMGSVWRRLGTEVIVVEFLDRVLPPMDGAVSREMKKTLSRQGFKFHLSTGVTAAEVKDGQLHVQAKDKKGKTLSFVVDKALVAVGRRPYTDGLGAEEAGVALDDHGRVVIDDHFRATAKGVYAIGDVVRGLMLAHKAEDEGVAVAEIIAGKPGHVNYAAIPNIVYTWPEVASVGQTEEEVKQAGVPYRVGQVSFRSNARARCMDAIGGFVKIIAHEETDRILGVHIVGANASELIQEAVLAIEYQASAEDLARTVHGHPALCETVKEAALAVDNRAIHV